MHVFLSVLRRIGENPWLRLAAAVVLLCTGLFEAFEALDEELTVGVHHGAILYGLVGVLRALPDTLDGVEVLNEVHEGAHADD